MSFASDLAARSQKPIFYDDTVKEANEVYWHFSNGCKAAAQQGKRTYCDWARRDRGTDLFIICPIVFGHRLGDGKIDWFVIEEWTLEKRAQQRSLLKDLIYSKLSSDGFHHITLEYVASNEVCYPRRTNFWGKYVRDKKRPYQEIYLRISVSW